MITRVQAKNFRNLADIDVELGPLMVLVGRNSAGKSTFLDVLRFVRDALHLGLDTAISQRGGISAIRRWSSNGRKHDIEIILDFQDGLTTAQYGFTLESARNGAWRLKREFCQIDTNTTLAGKSTRFEYKDGRLIDPPNDFFSGRTGQPKDFVSERIDPPNDFVGEWMKGLEFPVNPDGLQLLIAAAFNSQFHSISSQIASTNFYAVFPNTLQVPQRQTSDTTLLEGGQNLATTLRSIKKRNIFYLDLLSALESVVQGVNDFRVVETGGYLVVELKHELQNNRAAWFPLAQESDGTLRIIGLLAALYQETPHTLIAIEEPELSIHPGALTILSEVIKEAATRSQILITTQSPDLISQFKVDQIRVVEQTQGQTQIGTLDEAQRESINTKLFSSGDLLRIEGFHINNLQEPTPVHA